MEENLFYQMRELSKRLKHIVEKCENDPELKFYMRFEYPILKSLGKFEKKGCIQMVDRTFVEKYLVQKNYN